MVDPTELRDLPPDRFGTVVAKVVEDAWDGDLDVSPPSPDGSVDVVIRDDVETRLFHVRQGDPIDEDAVRDVSRFASDGGFDGATLATTETVTEAGRVTARDGRIDLLDGDSFSALVDDADVETAPAGAEPVATVVSQIAGHWPDHLREVAVELATTIEDAAEFDRELSRGSRRTDIDFRSRVDGRVVARMRFLGTSLLVYVGLEDGMESVLRLTAHRSNQPSVHALEADLRAALEDVLEE